MNLKDFLNLSPDIWVYNGVANPSALLKDHDSTLFYLSPLDWHNLATLLPGNATPVAHTLHGQAVTGWEFQLEDPLRTLIGDHLVTLKGRWATVLQGRLEDMVVRDDFMWGWNPHTNTRIRKV